MDSHGSIPSWNSYLEVASHTDPAILNDQRVVTNMLAEERAVYKTDYCSTLQTEIKPHMRKIVVDWMLEVCEDQGCVAHVFHNSVTYLDRFLSASTTSLPKKCFQSLAAGCLLLASKFCEVRPLSSEKLSLYTDHSVSVEELRGWEVKILNTLQWELSAVTVQSFIEHFAGANFNQKARRHAEILAATGVTEYKFLMVRPSLLAAAALSAACRGLNLQHSLPAVLQKEINQVSVLVEHLESLLQSYRQYTDVTHVQSAPNQTKHQSSSKPREGTLTPTDCHQVSALVGA